MAENSRFNLDELDPAVRAKAEAAAKAAGLSVEEWIARAVFQHAGHAAAASDAPEPAAPETPEAPPRVPEPGIEPGESEAPADESTAWPAGEARRENVPEGTAEGLETFEPEPDAGAVESVEPAPGLAGTPQPLGEPAFVQPLPEREEAATHDQSSAFAGHESEAVEAGGEAEAFVSEFESTDEAPWQDTAGGQTASDGSTGRDPAGLGAAPGLDPDDWRQETAEDEADVASIEADQWTPGTAAPEEEAASPSVDLFDGAQAFEAEAPTEADEAMESFGGPEARGEAAPFSEVDSRPYDERAADEFEGRRSDIPPAPAWMEPDREEFDLPSDEDLRRARAEQFASVPGAPSWLNEGEGEESDSELKTRLNRERAAAYPERGPESVVSKSRRRGRGRGMPRRLALVALALALAVGGVWAYFRYFEAAEDMAMEPPPAVQRTAEAGDAALPREGPPAATETGDGQAIAPPAPPPLESFRATPPPPLPPAEGGDAASDLKAPEPEAPERIALPPEPKPAPAEVAEKGTAQTAETAAPSVSSPAGTIPQPPPKPDLGAASVPVPLPPPPALPAPPMAQPEPAPAPKPAPVAEAAPVRPSPKPAEKPAPAPEAMPRATPEPAPEPKPVPVPKPAAVEAPVKKVEAPAGPSVPQSAALPPEAAPERAAPPSDPAAAYAWFEKSAREGDPKAQHDLAILYAQGKGVAQDYEQAAHWFREAALQGIPNAQYNLGVLYEQGLGVKQDLLEALLWYLSAAEQGHPAAQYNVGVAYAEGKGIPKNYAEAHKWFTKAAGQGIPAAQYNLGVIYENGLGVDRDRVEAYTWYVLSSETGESDGRARAARVEKALSDAQRADAEQRLRAARSRIGRQGPAAAAGGAGVLEPAPGGGAGSREVIAAIQRLLTRVGFDPGPADGIPGQKTTDAIMAYQREAGLTVDGNPTPELQRHMESVIGAGDRANN